jgi:hypothetical protein
VPDRADTSPALTDTALRVWTAASAVALDLPGMDSEAIHAEHVLLGLVREQLPEPSIYMQLGLKFPMLWDSVTEQRRWARAHGFTDVLGGDLLTRAQAHATTHGEHQVASRWMLLAIADICDVGDNVVAGSLQRLNVSGSDIRSAARERLGVDLS